MPTIDDVLKACKGRIGLNLELKGTSADEKMVEDLIVRIKEAKMMSQVIFTSLDYELIALIETKDPSVTTGFIYFLSFGDIAAYNADYLIIEEAIATDANIDKIHSQGKKAVVWTVNSETSMDKFSNTDIDAIITDEIAMLKRLLNEKKHKERSEQFIEFFFKP